MSERIKQVIVIRKDLKMRRGKEIAQGSHASMAFLSNRIRENLRNFIVPDTSGISIEEMLQLDENELAWLEGSFAKVCLQVNSEEELFDVESRAKAANLQVEMIVDSGRTEFDGVPTPTCLAIGPDDADKIDDVTGGLALY